MTAAISTSESCPERLHRGALLAVQHDVDLLGLGPVHHLASRRARGTRSGRPCRSPGGRRRSSPRTPSRRAPQLGQVQALLGSSAAAASFFFCSSDPRRVAPLRLHLDHDRHEAVLLAAELGALAAIDADLLGPEPGVAHEAGDRVLLDAERRHPPGVDHVVGRDQDAHLLADRHHQRLVDLEQVVLALVLAVVDLLERRRKVRVQRMPSPSPAGSRSPTSTGSR